MAIPADANIADFIVDLTYDKAQEGEGDERDEGEGKEHYLVRKYRESELKGEMEKELAGVAQIHGPELFLKEEGKDHKLVRSNGLFV